MFETETFEVILRRMLTYVANKYDKREGSFVYDNTAPTAVEAQNIYISLDVLLNELFPDTASRAYLIKHCLMRNIVPKEASPATVTGQFTPDNLEIPIGTRFSHDDFNYTVIEKISDGLYYLQCETLGSEPNGVTGQLIPIDYIAGLQTAEIIEVTFIGEDEEETEALRARYMASTVAERFGGNEMDYKATIKSISRVGQVKLYRAAEWNGGGTVKAVITDSDNQVPSSQLVDDVQTIIDPEGNNGAGDGTAPIGHFVTIVGANKTTVDITCTLSYKSGFTWETVRDNVVAAVDKYLASLNAGWEETEKMGIRVRISHVENAILNVTGILDIQDTMLNGKEENLAVDKDSLIYRGTINGY